MSYTFSRRQAHHGRDKDHDQSGDEDEKTLNPKEKGRPAVRCRAALFVRLL